jgi:hypothetical protein
VECRSTPSYAVFADFASDGDGSKFKGKKMKPVGKLILFRFNGDAEFALESTVLRIEHNQGGSWLVFMADTSGTVIKSLPDTEELHAGPSARISISVATPETKKLMGRKFSLPISFCKQTGDNAATFYYVEHESLEGNEIEFVSRKRDRHLIRWTGRTTDVNIYAGSKPDTRVEIEGRFTLNPQD